MILLLLLVVVTQFCLIYVGYYINAIGILIFEIIEKEDQRIIFLWCSIITYLLL